jgi:hypothetical protein
MASSSNLVARPRFKAFVRLDDNATILVSLDFVRMVVPIEGGVRLEFSGSPEATRSAYFAVAAKWYGWSDEEKHEREMARQESIWAREDELKERDKAVAGDLERRRYGVGLKRQDRLHAGSCSGATHSLISNSA